MRILSLACGLSVLACAATQRPDATLTEGERVAQILEHRADRTWNGDLPLLNVGLAL